MAMSSDLPPPSANLSFPPVGTDLHFSNLDSFVTSWETPEHSTTPCVLEVFFFNNSNQDAGWNSKFDRNVPLNGTLTVPLNYIDTEGLGMVNLRYVDPVVRSRRALGPQFHIHLDDATTSGITWNRAALTSSTVYTGSSMHVTSPSSSTPSSILSPSSFVSSPTPSPPITNITPTPSALLATSAPTPAKASTAPGGGGTASIILGTALGIVLAILLFMLWRRRQRKKKESMEIIPMPSTPMHAPLANSAGCEKDAMTLPTELVAGDDRVELPTGMR